MSGKLLCRNLYLADSSVVRERDARARYAERERRPFVSDVKSSPVHPDKRRATGELPMDLVNSFRWSRPTPRASPKARAPNILQR
jgi:hypothetical protein